MPLLRGQQALDLLIRCASLYRGKKQELFSLLPTSVVLQYELSLTILSNVKQALLPTVTLSHSYTTNEYAFVLYTEEERQRKKEVIVAFFFYSAKRLYAAYVKSVQRKVPPFLALYDSPAQPLTSRYLLRCSIITGFQPQTGKPLGTLWGTVGLHQL